MLPILLAVALLLAACGGVTGTPAPLAALATPTFEQPTATPATPSPGPTPRATPDPRETPPPNVADQFSTDFSKHSVPYGEIRAGGPPKDGIPPIDRPRFIAVPEADGWLRPQEPVILLRIGDDARAYPMQILTWHEIVNDTVGGVPVIVTFCPLCNTAVVFERGLDGRPLDFGTTGRLRFSNLLMYDRQTESWWQQATGEAIVGAFTGRELVPRPAAIVSWADFKAAHPGGRVLSRETGHDREYGRNPYVGYDDINRPPFLYTGPVIPNALPPTARVVTVDRGGEAVAYPYMVLERARIVNDSVDGAPLVVLWTPGTASALDEYTVAGGRDVGSAGVFSRLIDGHALTFRLDGARIVDEQTGSEWNGLGRAIDGDLAGRQLEAVVAIEHFWFSWAAFRPQTRVHQPPLPS